MLFLFSFGKTVKLMFSHQNAIYAFVVCFGQYITMLLGEDEMVKKIIVFRIEN